MIHLLIVLSIVLNDDSTEHWALSYRYRKYLDVCCFNRYGVDPSLRDCCAKIDLLYVLRFQAPPMFGSMFEDSQQPLGPDIAQNVAEARQDYEKVHPGPSSRGFINTEDQMSEPELADEDDAPIPDDIAVSIEGPNDPISRSTSIPIASLLNP